MQYSPRCLCNQPSTLMASSSSTVYIANQPPLSRKARPCHSRHGLLVVTPPQRAPAAASPTLRSSRPPPEPARSSCLATMWRKIQGADDWAGLVEPLHPVLRDEVIRYGELVMACYKAFDVNPRSPRYLACRFGKGRLLKEVGLGAAGYEITRYVYATPPDVGSIIPVPGAARRGRWIGYVAVSSDSEVRRLGRRDVLVAFRGTVTNAEWAANLMSSLTPASFDPHDPRPGVEVESGFLSLYTSSDGAAKFGHGSCREQLLKEVSRLISKHKEEEMSVTVAGHSMGSALAVLFGYDLSELGLNRFRLRREVPVTVYSFGGPRVGNAGFKERCEELGLKVLRVANVHDPVTKLPGLFMNENVLELLLPWRCSCYVHLGVELALDFFKVQNPACAHDLETYIGLLKCPGKMVQVHKEGVLGLLEKARMILLKKKMMMMMMMMKRRFQGWAWPDAALRHVGNWVQSLRLI